MADKGSLDLFVLISAVEKVGSFDSSALSFLSNLGNKIRASSGDYRETSFLFQRIIHRFNSVLLHDSFAKDGPDQLQSTLDFNFFFLTLGIYTTKCINNNNVCNVTQSQGK